MPNVQNTPQATCQLNGNHTKSITASKPVVFGSIWPCMYTFYFTYKSVSSGSAHCIRPLLMWRVSVAGQTHPPKHHPGKKKISGWSYLTIHMQIITTGFTEQKYGNINMKYGNLEKNVFQKLQSRQSFLRWVVGKKKAQISVVYKASSLRLTFCHLQAYSQLNLRLQMKMCPIMGITLLWKKNGTTLYLNDKLQQVQLFSNFKQTNLYITENVFHKKQDPLFI